ncbi:chaperonin 10-like protein [Cyathus striatus]|nr:chaperonin 10-like protein [Cyathus striatus]
MSQQKAIFLEGVGGDFVLRATEIYTPAAGELLVKIRAAALNPADWKIGKYDLGFLKFPVILGLDIAGDVVEVGEGVQGFSKGDRVFFQGDFTRRNTGFQQYTTAPAVRTAKIPTTWSYDQAATLPIALLTAWTGMYHKLPLGLGLSGPTSLHDSPKGKYANTPIVIFGGASSVGQIAIQLARFSGFSPIITTASLKHESTLKSLGATHLIDRSLPLSSLPAEVANITEKPIALVYDAITSQETLQAGYDLLANGGTIASVNPDVKINESEGSGKTVIQASAYALAPPENVQLVKEIYGMITSFLESGAIVPNRVEVLPNGLRGVFEGLKRLENNQVSAGKLVLHPDETD